jgi:hypothetical protein
MCAMKQTLHAGTGCTPKRAPTAWRQRPLQGAQLRDGLLCQEQDSLPGGMSREGSMCDRRDAAAPSLAEAVKENWVGAPNRLASHPISELVGNGGEEEAMPGDIEDEFEGTLRAVALTALVTILGRFPARPVTAHLPAMLPLPACLCTPLQESVQPTHPVMTSAMWAMTRGLQTQRLCLSR